MLYHFTTRDTITGGVFGPDEQDILTCSDEELGRAQVLMTMVGGST